ncbi:hypothetical protein G4228_009883 [Cervus hanglu yarkandensis]|nr:hypothetical protein G4228_009883 [Cervus hanglu yarkandensis]
MHPPRVPHAALDTKRKTAARPFSGLWKVSDPTLLQMTLVAGLLASVLEKQCRNLGDLPNGKVEVKTDFLFGSTIEFSCSEGYILVGSATSHCEIQDKGVDWSDPLPQCIIAKCEPPPAISNGRHNGGDEDFYTYGSSVTYSCDPDFSMLGKASISCTVENKTIGVWYPSPPTCKNIVCHPPRVRNGNILSGFGPIYHYKDSILFSCKKGYILNGSSLIRCDANNKWHPSPPTCELTIVCDPPQVPNGIILSGVGPTYNYEDSVLFSCEKGYILNGSNLIHCGANDKWHPSLPTCELITCVKPEVENGKLSVDKEKYVASENVTVQCNPGFSLVGPQIITCSENTTWHPTVPTCHWVNCTIVLYFHGDCVSYSCDMGYFPVLMIQRITCQGVGIWSPKMPPYCESPPGIDHGQRNIVSKYFQFEREAEYECDEGYTLVGANRLSCTSSGWSPATPQCKALCLKPTIEHGRLSVEKVSYVEPERITIQCESGYRLVGSENITCSEDRTWSPVAPKCEWEYPEGCEQVIASKKLLQCLSRPEEVKFALEVYKLSLEIALLELQIDKRKDTSEW